MTETKLPFDPVEREERYTQTDAADDPVRKEAEAVTAEASAEEIKVREERILDIPVPIRVGSKTYQYTSRPMGFVKMTLAEFLGISGVILDIQTGMNKMIESDDDKSEVTTAHVHKLLLEKGDEASKILYRIVQLLLEPVSGGPPDLANPHVSLEAIEWEMEVSEIAFLFSKFLARDIFALGGAVKNLIGFSQQT